MPRGILGPDTFIATGTGVARQAPDLGTIISASGVATCSSGNVSATWRVEGSNDGVNWFPVGADVVISAGASPQLSSAIRVQFAWAQYRTNCTALTGTGAQLVTTIAVGA